MKKYALILTIFGSTWLRADQNTHELSDHLRKNLAPSLISRQESFTEIKKCSDGIHEIQDESLYVFISFSMGDEAILALANEVSSVKGVLLLRGIPQNSFKSLAKKLLDLKQKGLTAEIRIDPKAYCDYGITAIPSFVKLRKNGFDKITGNISLSYALERFSEAVVQ